MSLIFWQENQGFMLLSEVADSMRYLQTLQA